MLRPSVPSQLYVCLGMYAIDEAMHDERTCTSLKRGLCCPCAQYCLQGHSTESWRPEWEACLHLKNSCSPDLLEQTLCMKECE